MSTAADIEAQAAAWIARLDGGGSALKADLHAWLAANTRHRAAYLRLAEAWRRTASLERLRPADGGPDPDLLAPRRRQRLWMRSVHRDRRAHRTETPRPDRPLRARLPAAARRSAAAAVVAALGLGLWWLQSLPRTQVFRTGADGLSRVVLSDGSSVILNSNTVVRVRYTRRERSLWLARGEAQFLDAHDTHRPFEVHAGNRIVLAVGTAFDVRLNGAHSLDVMVTEGRVALMAAADARPTLAAVPPPVLTAGQLARVRADEVTVSDIGRDVLSRRLSWEHRELSFRGETLDQAIAQFNRYNSRKLVIEDPAIAALRVGGTFNGLDTASFVAALRRAFGISARTSASGTIYLSVAAPR